MEAGTVPIKAPDGGSWGASPALLRLASDARLIAHVRAGRERAFETVYDRHHRSILAFCTHLLGDRHEAEDALQHTFIAAYNGILSSDQDIQLRPWLFAIARNRCFSLLRARREMAVPELDDRVADEPAAVVQRREDLRDLVEDVSRLPSDQRAALVMAEISALSHDEIALALEVPREKVKALVFQARESLVATRTARETDCADIRTELITLRGPALRRRHLRRHLHECEGCRAFRSQLRRQHSQLAALLPLAPSWALKEAVLRSTADGRAAGALGGSGTVAASAVKAGALKAAMGAAVTVLSAASAVVAVRGVVARHRAPVPRPVRLALPFARVPDPVDAAAKARVFVRATGGAGGTAPAHATLRHAGALSSARRYAGASMSLRLESRPARPRVVETSPRPTAPPAASPLQASTPPHQGTQSLIPVAGVTPKPSGDVKGSSGGASTGAGSGPTGDHGTTGGTPTGDHGTTGGTPTGDHGTTGGTPTGDHGTTVGGSTSGGSTTGGVVAGESSGGARHRRAHLHEPRAGSPSAATSPVGAAAPATSSATSTATTGGAPAAGATLTSPAKTSGTSAGRTPVATGATPTGIDQYRPVITSTRRTAPWPKPKDHSPAKSSPSPAAPVASGAPPRRH